MRLAILYSLVVVSAVAYGAVIQQSPAPSTLPPNNEVLGGQYGLVNIINVVANFIGGFDRPKGDETGFVEDLKLIFPSLKTSGLGRLLSTVVQFHNVSSFFSGFGGSSTTKSPASPSSSGNIDLIKSVVSKVGDPNLQVNLETFCDQVFGASSPLSSLLMPILGAAPIKCSNDLSGGTGPYKANYTTDPTLPNHTIYAPLTPPADVKLPVLVFGNGLCLAWGTMYSIFLTEIASHGFIVVATGKPNLDAENLFGHVSDIKAGIDWVTGPEARKYGNIDTSTLAVGGQSCGGLEAYSASHKDDRVKFTLLLNSAAFEGRASKMVTNLSAPVAYFVGGPKDIGYNLVHRDFPQLKVPALKASLNVGHMGTYLSKSGGSFGKAVVGYLSWKQKGDESYKPLFCNPDANSALVKDGWEEIEAKNGMC